MRCAKKKPMRVPFLILFLALSGSTGFETPVAADPVNHAVGCEAETCNVIHGFSGNKAAAGVGAATISGGGRSSFPNQVTADMGSIGGGIDNRAGELATVGGGAHNSAEAFRAMIGGGAYNVATRDSSTISGGYGNKATGSYAAVGGGAFNTAGEVKATVGGGSGNVAGERHATISGGTVNTAGGLAASIGGGVQNTADAAFTTIAGGINNRAGGIEATVGGGAGNQAGGQEATVAGGMNNRATDNYTVVSGGLGNVAGNSNLNPTDAIYAAVGGGVDNAADGSYSVVPGGSSNRAAGAYSFAAGHRARIAETHKGAFLFADSNASDFSSLAADEFAVRATGGVRLVTAVDQAGKPLAGVRLTAGSGSWESFCDREAESDLVPADAAEILEQVTKLPLNMWSYKTQSVSIRHLGPTAQDFYAAFGLGTDKKHISLVDADGIALASIQGLYRLILEKDDRLKVQRDRIEALESMVMTQQNKLEAVEARLKDLEKAAGGKANR
jgi:hypothetical protein